MAVPATTETAGREAQQLADTAAGETGAVVSHATDAASDVAGTAKEQLGAVAEHAAGQGQQLVEQAQEQLGSEAERQASSLADNIRQLANELHAMSEAGSQGGALQTLVAQLASKSEVLAAKLEQDGPNGLLRDVQAMGRRRPGAFLIGAVAAGFATTRLAKHTAKAGDEAVDPYPSTGTGR